LQLIVPTQATSTPGTVPSLCMLFLEGRCHHPWCRQAHIPPEVISRLREEALNTPTCCGYHMDAKNNSFVTTRFQKVIVHGQEASPSRLAVTVGLHRLVLQIPPDTVMLEVPSKLVCRLHFSKRCRYLEDCNNIHVCRELEGAVQVGPAPQVGLIMQHINASTKQVTIGDITYAVTQIDPGHPALHDPANASRIKVVDVRTRSPSPPMVTFPPAQAS
jgi:hypothetical protein